MQGFIKGSAIALCLGLSLASGNANAEIVRRTSTSTLNTSGTSVTSSVRNSVGADEFLKEVRDVSRFADGTCGTTCSSATQDTEIRQVESSSSTWTDATTKEIRLNIDLQEVTDTFYLGTGQLGTP